MALSERGARAAAPPRRRAARRRPRSRACRSRGPGRACRRRRSRRGRRQASAPTLLPRAANASATHPGSFRSSTSHARTSPTFATAFPSGELSFELLGDEAEHRARRGRAEVFDDCLDVVAFQPPRQLPPLVPASVDLRHEHETLAREQRARVAGDDDVGPGRAVPPAATSRSIEPGSKRPRSRSSVRSTFGRSLPVTR